MAKKKVSSAPKKAPPKKHPSYLRAEGMTQTTISLKESLLDRIKAMADGEDRSVSNLFVHEMTKAVQKWERQRGGE